GEGSRILERPSPELTMTRSTLPRAKPLRRSLDEGLSPAPSVVEGRLQATADVDGPADLKRHGVWRLDTARHFYLRESTRELVARPADHDQRLRGAGTRAPEVVVVVRADRGGQAVRSAVVVDRARLTIVSRDDPGLGPFLRGQRSIDPRDLPRQLFPAKTVGEVLVQGAEGILLPRGWRDAESPLIGDEGLHRQHRHGEGGGDGTPQRQHHEQGGPDPAPPASLAEAFHDQRP